MVVDVTENSIHRPTKRTMSGKKQHTLKTQLIIERNTLYIFGVQQATGSEHDCKVHNDTVGNGISNAIPLDADLGYQGIAAYRANSCIRYSQVKTIS